MSIYHDTERDLLDGKTIRCPAVGLTGQCTRPYERHGHQVGPHDPPDACYFDEPPHPASYYNED